MGAPAASCNSENFVEWLADSLFRLFNTSDPAHVAPNLSCFFNLSFDMLQCFFDCVFFQVEEDTYDSDHFPVSIAVDFNPPPLLRLISPPATAVGVAFARKSTTLYTVMLLPGVCLFLWYGGACDG